MFQLLYRPAESDGEFMLLGTAATLAGAREELMLPVGLRPHHGDLVRIVGDDTDRLFVFDAARSSFVKVPRRRGKKQWLEFWEGDRANATDMLRACENVDRNRVTLAACDIAEAALRYVPFGEDSPRAVIEALRGLVSGNYAMTRRVSSTVENARYFAIKTDNLAAAYAAIAAIDAAFHPYMVAESVGKADNAYLGAARPMAPLVRRHIPLSVLACSLVGAADPLPIRFKE